MVGLAGDLTHEVPTLSMLQFRQPNLAQKESKISLLAFISEVSDVPYRESRPGLQDQA